MVHEGGGHAGQGCGCVWWHCWEQLCFGTQCRGHTWLGAGSRAIAMRQSCCLHHRRQAEIGEGWRMRNRGVQSLWNGLGMWPKPWLGCTTFPCLCAETRCSSMFCPVSVGYVTLAVLLGSFFPLMRWTWSALHHVLNPMPLSCFQPRFEFLCTQCLCKVLFKGMVTLCLSALSSGCGLPAPSCFDSQGQNLTLPWLRQHFHREEGLGCSKPTSAVTVKNLKHAVLFVG